LKVVLIKGGEIGKRVGSAVVGPRFKKVYRRRMLLRGIMVRMLDAMVVVVGG
jgi:hypothetical protein